MNKISLYVNRFLDSFVGIALAGVFVVTFLMVINRFLFRINIPWATDIIRLSFVYLVMLGAAVGVRERAHLNIDFIPNILPDKARDILAIITNIVIALFLLFLVYQGYQVAIGALYTMPYIRMPMGILYAAIPVSALLMIFYLIPQIIEQIKGVFNTGSQ